MNEYEEDDIEFGPVPDAPPLTCPWCGGKERTEWLLNNNHWPTTGVSRSERACIAMNLTRNHLIYACREGEDTTRQVAAIRRVWPADRLDWLDDLLATATTPLLF